MIKLNDLAIGYNGEAILEHIDQEFDDGLIYGILAKSGAGKTTLLKTISGLLHPVHGEVVIDGTTYRNADKNPVYMMHQRYSNFGWLSCTENVLIAQRDKKLRSRDDAIKVLAAVGLEQASSSSHVTKLLQSAGIWAALIVQSKAGITVWAMLLKLTRWQS